MDKAEFLVKMTEVAGLLGMRVEIPGHGYPALYLVGEGERSGKLYARIYEYRHSGKMEISGEYPRFDGQSCSPRDIRPVGISLTKSAEQVAHDIQRRVLPTYRENLAVAWERHDAWTASRERRVKMMMHIACEVDSEVSDRGTIFPPSPWSDHIYNIESYGDDKVQMELTAPEDLAIKILGVIKAHVTGGPNPKEG